MIESNQTTHENNGNKKQPEILDNSSQKLNSSNQGELQEDIPEARTLTGNGELREAVFLTGNSQMANAGLVLLGCIQTGEANAQPSQVMKVLMVDQANTSQNVKLYRKIEPKPGSKTEGEEKAIDETQVCEETALALPVKKAKIAPKSKFVESNPTRRGVKSCPRCQQLIGYRAKQCKFCFPRTIKKRQIKDIKVNEDIRKSDKVQISVNENSQTTEEVVFVPSAMDTTKIASNIYQVAGSEVFINKEDISVISENNTPITSQSCSILEGAACTVSTGSGTSNKDAILEQESQTETGAKINDHSSSSETSNGTVVNVVAVIEDHIEEKDSTNMATKNVVYNEVSLHDLVVTLLKNDNQNKNLVASDPPMDCDSEQTKEIEVKTGTVIGNETDSKSIHIVNILPESTPQEVKKLEPDKVPGLPVMTSSTTPVVVGPVLCHPITRMKLVPVPKVKDTQGSLFRRIEPKGGDNEGEGEGEGGEDVDDDMMEGSGEFEEDEENELRCAKKNKKLRRRSSSKGEYSRLLETNATRRGLMQCTKCFKKIGCRSKICKFCKGSLFDNSNSGPTNSPPAFELPASLKGQNVIELSLSPERYNAVFSIRKYKSGPDNRCFVKCMRKTKDDDSIFACDYAACSSSIENNGSLGGFSCEHVKLCLKNKTEQAIVVSLQQEALRNFPESLQKELQIVYKDSISMGVPLVQWVSERTFAVHNTISNVRDGVDNFVHVRFQKSRPLVFCSGKFCLMNTVQKGGSYCVHYHACLWAIASDYRLRAMFPLCRLTV